MWRTMANGATSFSGVASPLGHLRIPPQHLESERALLGAILLRPEVLYDIVDALSPEAFYADKHRRIYAAMLELFPRRDPLTSFP